MPVLSDSRRGNDPCTAIHNKSGLRASLKGLVWKKHITTGVSPCFSTAERGRFGMALGAHMYRPWLTSPRKSETRYALPWSPIIDQVALCYHRVRQCEMTIHGWGQPGVSQRTTLQDRQGKDHSSSRISCCTCTRWRSVCGKLEPISYIHQWTRNWKLSVIPKPPRSGKCTHVQTVIRHGTVTTANILWNSEESSIIEMQMAMLHSHVNGTHGKW